MIYFMQSTDGGPVKIGYSADVDARHKQLETHYGCALAVLATMPGDMDTEAEIHAQFDHLRLSSGKRGGRPEQFRPGPDLMAFLGRPLLVSADPDAVEVMDAERIEIRLRVSLDLRDRIQAAAADDETTVAAFIRTIIVRELRRREKESAE